MSHANVRGPHAAVARRVSARAGCCWVSVLLRFLFRFSGLWVAPRADRTRAEKAESRARESYSVGSGLEDAPIFYQGERYTHTY